MRSLHVLSAGLLAIAPLLAQEKPPVPAPNVDVQKIMAQMVKLAAVGPEHRRLQQFVGEFEVAGRCRMGKDQPWQDTKGSVSGRSLLGGRYVQLEWSIAMMGMPVQGLQIFGFDNLRKVYTVSWRDDCSTWEVTAQGGLDDGGTLVCNGIMVDAVTPDGRPYRSEVQFKDDGTIAHRMFDTIAGEQVLVMEGTFTRKPAAGTEKPGTDKPGTGKQPDEKK